MQNSRKCMSKSFKASKPIKNCLLLEFETRKELTLTFCRVEEYYEGKPSVNGKYITLEKFIDEFMTDDGVIDYFYSWSGFNIPGKYFKEWFGQNASDKTKWEIQLANVVSNKIDMTKPFYVIGALKGADAVISHELAHALYSLNEKYKSAMSTLNLEFRNIQLGEYNKIIKKLKNMGYGDNVAQDELQAYMSTSTKKELVDRFGVDYTKIAAFVRKYRKVLQEYNTFRK